MSDFNETIQRCPHDKEHPYAMISRDLIRDKNLSPECRMLLIYLLSHTENWQLNPKQLHDHFGDHIGVNKIYKLITEAMEAGYILREDIKINNLRRSCKYFVSETPKFKKCFRRYDFRDHGIRNHENSDITKEHIPESEEKPLLEEPPPLISSLIKEKTKEDWWRSYFSKVTSKELFDSAWHEYLEQPLGSVKHLKGWLTAVIQRKLAEESLEAEKQELINKHREEAKRFDNFLQGNTIVAEQNYVRIVRGQIEDHIPYNLNEEDWKKATELYFR